jgi:membrane protein
MTSSTTAFDSPPSRPEPSKNEHRPRNASWRGRLGEVWTIVKETVTQWMDDEAPRQAASLALYTLLSIAPLLILSIKLSGIVLGDEAARGQISQQISGLVGAQAGQAIEAMVANARTPGQGVVGSIVGLFVLLFGASGVFGELQTSLNRMWDVKPRPGRGIIGFLRDRFFSFTMVLGVAFLLLVSMVLSAALLTITEHFKGLLPLPALWQILNAVLALAMTTGLFALIFKVVPDAKIEWRDVWVGAFVAALLFTAGKTLLAWYVGRSATTSAFGAAGSLVALIVWVYYSAQLLFFGAEFAQVYATHTGSRIVPTKNAVPLEAKEVPH